MDNTQIEMQKHIHKPGYKSGCLVAFHGDANVKKRYVDKVNEHAINGHYKKGCFWEKHDVNGEIYTQCCSVGGILGMVSNIGTYTDAIEQHASLIGIPVYLSEIHERIFEGFESDEDARDFAVAFIKAIPVGFNNWTDLLKKVVIPQLYKSATDVSEPNYTRLEILDSLSTTTVEPVTEEIEILHKVIVSTHFEWGDNAERCGKAIIDYFARQTDD